MFLNNIIDSLNNKSSTRMWIISAHQMVLIVNVKLGTLKQNQARFGHNSSGLYRNMSPWIIIYRFYYG